MLVSLLYAGPEADSLKVISSGGRGSLEVLTLPPNAQVKIGGRGAGLSPLVIDSLEAGFYQLMISHAGFASHRVEVEVKSNQKIKIQIALSKEIYLTWRQEYSMTVASSIILPGKGQVDHGHQRGWVYFLTYVGAAGLAYYSSTAYKDAQNQFNRSLAHYRAELEPLTPEETWNRYRNVSKARDDMTKHRDRFNAALVASGVIWMVNMIDVFFFTVEKPVVQ